MAQRAALAGAGRLHPARCRLTGRLVSPSRSQLQTPSSYGPVLSPMNKVHGGGINKLPSVNQLVGQPAQHSSGSAPSLGPMGKVLTSPGAAVPAAAGGRQPVLAGALPARQAVRRLPAEGAGGYHGWGDV